MSGSAVQPPASTSSSSRPGRLPPGDIAVLTLTSWFGCGYLPGAPGTWGTLGSLPLWWLLSGVSAPVFGAAVVALIAIAVALSSRAEKIYGAHDVGKIVIDETAGLMVTAIGVPFRWPEVLAAFALFRLLDALKPWPIRWLDRHVSGGFGVVIDDVAAGAIACLLLHGARMMYGGWW